MTTKISGKTGEDIAAGYLKRRGYRILDRNFFLRAAHGPKIAEVDIVTKKDGIFSFVEVKTLRTQVGWNFMPQDKVNAQKLWKISKAAELWLLKSRIPLNVKWQIDVIAVEFLPDERPNFIKWLLGPKLKISHFPNAGHR